MSDHEPARESGDMASPGTPLSFTPAAPQAHAAAPDAASAESVPVVVVVADVETVATSHDGDEAPLSDVVVAAAPNPGSGTFPCPACRQPCKVGSRFCEDCGARLLTETVAPVARCHSCGGTEFEAGHCMGCGAAERVDRGQPDETTRGPGLAALTDTGLVHMRNDDAFAISGPPGGGPGSLMVVCDGVSRSQNPDVASAAAAKEALTVAQRMLDEGSPVEEALRVAIKRAHVATCATAFDPDMDMDPPCSTIVIAAVMPGSAPDRVSVTFGWLGDTRIAWLSANGGKVLTHDHSWFNLQVDSGSLTAQEAGAHKLAHAIVKCMGAEKGDDCGPGVPPPPCPEPDVATVELPREGWIAAYTDGLWNYAETVPSLLVAANGTLSRDAKEACRRLVSFAKGRGGQDNVTVALCRLSEG